MQIKNEELIDHLLSLTEKSVHAARKFKELPAATLNFKKTDTSWSILECLEHLTLYGDFYLPEIENQIIDNKDKKGTTVFRSGMIGNFFVNLIKVKNGKVYKIKSPKDKNPNNSLLTITTIERFIKQQELLKSLLTQAYTINLTKVKVPISLTKLIRLRLGDTFRFYVYHIERHILQAEMVVSQQSAATKSGRLESSMEFR